MNCLRKVYCRTYQTAFRIALPILPYKTPKLLENVDDLPRMLKKQGKKQSDNGTKQNKKKNGKNQPFEKYH